MATDPNKDWPIIRAALVKFIEDKVINDKLEVERLNLLKFFILLEKENKSGKKQPYCFTESKLFSFIEDWYVSKGLIKYDRATDSYQPTGDAQ